MKVVFLYAVWLQRRRAESKRAHSLWIHHSSCGALPSALITCPSCATLILFDQSTHHQDLGSGVLRMFRTKGRYLVHLGQVALSFSSMTMCGLIHASILKMGRSYVTEEEEAEFMHHCRDFALRCFSLQRPTASLDCQPIRKQHFLCALVFCWLDRLVPAP